MFSDIDVVGFDLAGVFVFLAVVCAIFALSFARPDQWGHRRIASGLAVGFGTASLVLLSGSLLWSGGVLLGGHQIHLGWSYVSRRYRTHRDHAEYLQSSVSVLAYIALADGDITSRESSLIRETYVRAGFSHIDIAELDKIIQHCQTRFQSDGSDYQRVFSWLQGACEVVVRHSNEHTRSLFFRTAILLAATDGFVSAEEDRALRAAAAWLGISADEARRVWRSVTDTGDTEADTGDREGAEQGGGSDRTREDPSAPPDLATHYAQLLGVPLSASPSELRRAYRAKARQYHPDVVMHRGPAFAREAEERFKELSHAYDFLRGHPSPSPIT